MKTWIRTIFIGLILFSNMSFAAGKAVEIKTSNLRLVFSTSQISSLVYQLDCLADLIRCESAVLQKFWKGQNWTADDDKAISEWISIFERYGQHSQRIDEVSEDVVKSIGFPIRSHSINFDRKFRIASFISNDLESYRNSISLLMLSEDVERSLRVLARFQARHQKWWNQFGAKQTDRITKDFIRLMKTKKLIPLMEQVSSFYQASLSTQTPVYFHFFVLPGKSSHSNGEEIENHAVIEVMEGDSAEKKIDVVLHELFHFFYRTVAIDKHIRLVQSFATHPDLVGIPAYNLLNEVLATAFGNGLVFRRVVSTDHFEKVLAKENSFYNDAPIDLVAKALMPKLEETLNRGGTLYDADFTALYIQTVKDALGNRAAAPQLSLRTKVAIYQKDLKKDLDVFSRQIRNGSTWSTSDFQAETNKARLKNSLHLSAVIAIKPDSLQLLKHWESFISPAHQEKIAGRARQVGGFVYTIPRSLNSWIFVVVANPGDEAKTAFNRLATAEKIEDLLIN